MSLEQISSAMNRGKKPAGIPVGSEEDILEVNRNWRKYVGI
jgi:hypothetical protein